MSEATTIYLDHHATTPLDPRVLEQMLPFLTTHFANAGSTTHEPGRAARKVVEEAREKVAHCLGCQPDEIIFTSGATESNNLALRGSADRPRRKGNHIVSMQTEHPSVLDPLSRLQRGGVEVTLLPPQPQHSPIPGLVDLDAFTASLNDETFLASVMWANNEVGVLQPVAQLAEICRDRGVTFHCDATQAVGKIPINLSATAIDLLSLSAHKFYGPKGIGALFIRRRPRPVRLAPLLEGGGQEQGLRSGTLNVPGIVGLAAALEIACQEMAEEQARVAKLRDRLFELLAASIPGVALVGPPLSGGNRLAGNLNCTFEGVAGETIMLNTPQLALSSGSACASANPEPSHVLLALGLSVEAARSSIRFGLGRSTMLQEIELAAQQIAAVVAQLRGAGN